MALDVCEPEIIRALVKQGWRVQDKPVMLRVGRRSVFADLRLARITEDLTEDVIITEVKCFSTPSNDLQELYTALGQYLTYRDALHQQQNTIPLYLAMPSEGYQRLTAIYQVEGMFERESVNIVIIDTTNEEVERWITWETS